MSPRKDNEQTINPIPLHLSTRSFLPADWHYQRPEDYNYDAYGPMNSLPRSRRSRHSCDPKPFPCSNCSSGFTYEKGLIQHRKFECGQKPRYRCPHCMYVSKWMNNVYKHVRTIHEGEEVGYIVNS